MPIRIGLSNRNRKLVNVYRWRLNNIFNKMYIDSRTKGNLNNLKEVNYHE